MSAQLLVNGLVNAALIAPPAIAFSLLFGVLRFPNFAIGGYITVGAFVAFAVNVQLGAPLWLAALAAMAATALVVWLTGELVFRPMLGHGPVTLLVVSIALTLILEHVIRLFYGGQVRGFDLPLQRSKLAGRNARLGVHGDTSTDPMVLIETNAGITGLGHRRVVNPAGEGVEQSLRRPKDAAVDADVEWGLHSADS
jgi:branched-subunit amino acid ABC-type transport system permease component